MFDLNVVQEAIKNSQVNDDPTGDNLISILIHDLFGGEILKTPKKNGWHFYNRIEGMRVDFTASKIVKNSARKRFKDIPATTEETYSGIEQAEYSSFLMRFVRVFEESIGLDRFQVGYSS
jgi:hypothetical protein